MNIPNVLQIYLIGCGASFFTMKVCTFLNEVSSFPIDPLKKSAWIVGVVSSWLVPLAFLCMLIHKGVFGNSPTK